MRSAQVLGVEIDVKGAGEIAMRSRGTPRLANRLLKRVRDFAQVKYDGRITYDVACFALNLLEVDQYGLDKLDRQILTTLTVSYTHLIREKIAYNDIPEAFQGFPTVLLTAGLMAIAFFGFSGLI